jgi:Lon protease-like protein
MKRPLSPADLPPTVPVLPLSGALLLPFAQRPLNVFEPRYIQMIDRALGADRLIGLVQPEDASEESPQGKVPLRRIGTLGRITHFEEVADERYLIILDGMTRFELGDELTVMTPYRQFRIDAGRFASDFEQGYGADAVNRGRFLKMMRDYAEFANLSLDWDEIGKTGTAELVNFCCMVSPYGAAEKQLLLEAPSLEDRAETLIALAEVEMARSGTGVPLQ